MPSGPRGSWTAAPHSTPAPASSLRAWSNARVASPQTGGYGMTTPQDPARIAIVIVTYNSADALGDCLLSLPDGAHDALLSNVVVADNASRDDSLTIAKEARDLPIQTIQVGRNAGYAAAINV